MIEVVRKQPGFKNKEPDAVWVLRDTETGEYYIASGITVTGWPAILSAMINPFLDLVPEWEGRVSRLGTDGEWEVLIFHADEHGNMTSPKDIAGGVNFTYERAIAELEKKLEAK